MRSPRRSARTCVTVRRIFAMGATNGTSCNPSVSCAVLAPSLSTKRPADSAASVEAPMASVPGLRPHTPRMPVPSAMRRVFTAAAAIRARTSWAQVSGRK